MLGKGCVRRWDSSGARVGLYRKVLQMWAMLVVTAFYQNGSSILLISRLTHETKIWYLLKGVMLLLDKRKANSLVIREDGTVDEVG